MLLNIKIACKVYVYNLVSHGSCDIFLSFHYHRLPHLHALILASTCAFKAHVEGALVKALHALKAHVECMYRYVPLHVLKAHVDVPLHALKAHVEVHTSTCALSACTGGPCTYALSACIECFF